MILLSAIGNFEIQLINHAKLKTNQKRKKKKTSKYSFDSIVIVNKTKMAQQSSIQSEDLAENSLLVWLDETIDLNKCKEFQRIISTVKGFNDISQAIQFVKEFVDEKICLIVSESMSKEVIPKIHDFNQIYSILIWSQQQTNSIDDKWRKKWLKIKGIFSNISSICLHLGEIYHECERNAMSTSFFNIQNELQKKNLKDLDRFYVCSQTLRDILQTIPSKQRHFRKFVEYARQLYINNQQQLDKIKEFEDNYHSKTPIYWYTYADFIYPMLNRMFRSMNTKNLTRMWFLIDDLHRHIGQLYTQQIQQSKEQFQVYRGQGFHKSKFEQLIKNRNDYFSFHNFVFATKNRQICYEFARNTQQHSDYVGVLFVLKIDPSQGVTPFASINSVSYYQYEFDEFLFSIHSIFRIENIQPIDEIFQITLTLTTNEHDVNLKQLTDFIRKESFPNENGWMKFSLVLCKFDELTQAKETLQFQNEQTKDQNEKANILYQLALIYIDGNQLDQALDCLEKSIDIFKENLPSKHFQLSECYDHLANIFYKLGQYEKALVYFDKTFEIQQKIFPRNHPSIAKSYSNLGILFSQVGRYENALGCFENALDIQQQILEPHHPLLATSLTNLGSVYDEMHDDTNAFSCYQRALTIRQQTLPSNHPDIACSLNNLGNIYQNTGQYQQALQFYQQALQIREKILDSNHPQLAESYNNIGNVYFDQEQYQQALSLYEKCLHIRQQILDVNHPMLGDIYNNIGAVYDQLEDYSQSLSFYHKALAIRQQTLPPNHPNLAVSYSNIGVVHDKLGEYPQAISSYEKAIEIQEKTLPSNHPDLASSYNNIGAMYEDMKNYSQALTFYRKALDIRLKSLPSNHHDLGVSFNNVAVVYQHLKDYPKALSFYEKGIQIQSETLPPNHPDLASSCNKIAIIYETMGDFIQAKQFYEQALHIGQRSLPDNHPHLLIYQNNVTDIQHKL